MSTNANILIVDDEEDIREFLAYNLQKDGFNVYTAENGSKAIKLAEEILPELIILDVMMPEMDGVETCEQLREIPSLNNTIIAFLTARSEDYSQIAGFDAGADDYITKPVRPKVLVSRIKALLKRHRNGTTNDRPEEDETTYKIGDLQIDRERFLIKKGDETLYLPKKEFYLLELLTSKPSKVFTREEIFNKIWGNDIFVGDRTIDVYIRKLREKIGEKSIVTIKGVGYKYEL
jgi:two-component system alkaline phosphatase synthesis response regulator PhoP